MTLGMFLPAFAFPIIGHDLFQALLRNAAVGLILDGVMAAVLGAVAIIGIQLLNDSFFILVFAQISLF